MKDMIETVVVVDATDANLQICHDEDVATFLIDGVEVFRMDWTNNLFEVCCKAIGNWKRID